MKKNTLTKVLLTGICAVALASCSSEEPVSGNGNEPVPPFSADDVAYLAIDIKDANTISKGEDGGFSYGVDEQDVTNAYFYFYDAEGNFVTEANIWEGDGNVNPGDKENVEYFGSQTVVLTGVGANHSAYMVTVLNRPDGFEYGNTLADMRDKVIASCCEGDNFIMTTTSYFGVSDYHDDTYYFATKLQEKNFLKEAPTKDDLSEDNRVEVYVERLAVKVQVNLNLTGGTTLTDGRTIYKVPMTVAGETNPGESGEAATDLYVAFGKWGLNSTSKKTALMKSLEGFTASTSVDGWNTWNQGALHRSYWGKSYNYGLSGAQLRETFDYVTYEDLKNEFNTGVAYCNESTNEAENIGQDGAVVPANTTSVLLKATVCDKDGNAVELVDYQGIKFLKSQFVTYVLNARKSTLQYYTRKVSSTDPDGKPLYEYTQISPDEVEVVAAGNGTGSVKIAVKKDVSLYVLGDPVENEGHVTYPDAVLADNAVVNTALARATDNNKAVCYTDGAMYYPIAIEHLNNPSTSESAIVDAQYGVVRNHCYVVTINQVKALGNGVFVPEKVGETGPDPEPLIPETPKEPKYYVGARINILSWKIVSQGVTLE